MGCERRVVYDFVNVIKQEATLNQALIKDKNCQNLYILPASQTRDKDALDIESVYRVLKELDSMGFEYIVCDSPAGIETGALMSLYFADIAIVTTNPEVSSVRDSDRIIGILDSKSRRAEYNLDPIKPYLLLTRYSPARVEADEMLSKDDVVELLSIELIGVIPESQAVLKASNSGKPIIYDEESDAGQAYQDTVKRILGEEVPFRFIDIEKKGFLKRLFGKK
jgi:septum site-determining protein MinD